MINAGIFRKPYREGSVSASSQEDLHAWGPLTCDQSPESKVFGHHRNLDKGLELDLRAKIYLACMFACHESTSCHNRRKEKRALEAPKFRPGAIVKSL